MPRDNVLAKVTSGQSRYGPIQENLQFDVVEGYTVLVGANNAGKSALLQLVFRSLMGEGTFAPDRICLIPPDRQYLAATTETSGGTLETFNGGLNSQLAGEPMPHETPYTDRPALARVLLTQTNMQEQLGRATEILRRLGLPDLRVGAGQTVQFEDIRGYLQGTGLRGLFPIVAALTDPLLRVILVDEPELSLEPTLQKALRDLLIEHADSGRAIIVSTHSHLFLDRRTIDANLIVRRKGSDVEVEAVQSEPQLLDVVFQLLGNSTEDLFFPKNYVVVEGASDQRLVERAVDLLGAKPGQIKVLSASGISSVEATIYAVERQLLPMIVSDSPYAQRVVAMIDQPRESEQRRVQDLEGHLGERLVQLPAPTLEEYVPERIYEAAGLDKDAELDRIRHATDISAKRQLKREASEALASAVNEGLLDEIPEIRRAAELALRAE